MPGIGHRLYLFGDPFLENDQGSRLAFRSRKSLALLGYLALNSSREHSREHLAGLFWPEFGDKDARNNLRVTLARLGKHLGEANCPLLNNDRHSVSLNAESTFVCDAVEFQELIHSTNQSTTQLARAVELYRADFMEGVHLDNCDEFEDWQHHTRESLRLKVQESLRALGETATHHGDVKSAEQWFRRLVSLDYYDEAAHRHIMALLASNGDAAGAKSHYALMCERFEHELGVKPGESSVQLIRAVESGKMHEVSDIAAVTDRAATALSDEMANRTLHNLPAEKTPYIGNREKLAKLTGFARVHRLVTLTGIGGVGKTRLALQAGRQLLSGFPGGVWFVRLASVSNRTEMLSNLAAALGLDIPPGDDPISSITGQLGAANYLVILDNFEHLQSENETISTLLAHAPQLSLLVTSRQRLQIAEEAVFSVTGLAFDSDQTEAETSEIPSNSPSDAAALFIGVARRTRLELDLDSQSLESIRRITQLVKGHPLALVIAAGWVDTLSCAQILQELEQGLEILETEFDGVPERQRSVRVIFNYSWSQLSKNEQRLFATLSVFRGGFDRQAAHGIASASIVHLSRLVRKSLLLHSPENDRYEMHELLRQFSEEKLYDLDLADSVLSLHSQHYLSVLGTISNDIFDSDAREKLILFDIELNNIRKAWYHALANVDEIQLVQAIRNLRLICGLGAHSHDLLEMLQPALPLIEESHKKTELQLGNPPRSAVEQQELIAHLLLALGFAYRYTRGYFASELSNIFARAYFLTSNLQTSPELFVVLYGRWSLNFTRGLLVENSKIIDQWRERLKAFDHLDQEPAFVSDARFVIDMLEGPQRQWSGELDEARKIIQAGIAREDPKRYGYITGNYGLNFAVSGRHWLAINQCAAGLIQDRDKSIAVARQIAEQENNPYLMMFVAFGQLIISMQCRDELSVLVHAEAVNQLVSEHHIFHAFRHHAEVYTAFANIRLNKSTDVDRLQSLVDSIRGIPIFQFFDYQHVADILVHTGSPDEAIELIDRETPIYIQKNIVISLAESSRIKGDALVKLGDTTQAVECYERALEIARAQGARLYELRACLALSRCHSINGSRDKAKQLLGPMLESFEGARSFPDLDEARAFHQADLAD